ncbi:MAG: NADH-quinone oxidoreductase subunit D [Candidatus Hydrogenedentota bacterium]
MPIKADELVINMGPQHPSTHGVLRLLLKTDGEIVREAKPVIGYLHRCFEKSAEGVAWQGVVPYADRMDYVGAIANEWPFCLAVEKLANLPVSERSEYCRVISAELQRIASHFLAFGTYGIDLGAFTPFLHAIRDREKVLDILEHITGARLLYNYIRPGGVMADIDKHAIEMIKRFIADVRKRLPDYHQLLTFNKIFIDRTAEVGIISREVAMTYHITGPNLRATGLAWDLRRNDPYGIYDRFDFKVAVGTGERGVLGDCWNRYIVRLIEIEESLRILDQAISKLPAGPISMTPKNLKAPPGEIYSRCEGPRGEIGYYVIADGLMQPFRVKAKSPSFCNLSGFEEYTRDMLISDIIATLGSIDIVLGEIDR